MEEPDVGALRDVVARRRDVLARIDATGVRKRTLVEAVDVSRSTVDRAVRDLEEYGLVERTNGGVSRTLAGRLALEGHDRLIDRLRGLRRAEPVLRSLPPGADLPATVFAGSEVFLPDAANPYRPMEFAGDLAKRSDRVRACAPAIIAPQVEMYRDAVVERGLTLDVVVTEAALERLVTEFSGAVQQALATGRCAVYRTDESLDYSLFVAQCPDGAEMGLGVYDEHGTTGYVGNDRPEAVEWARGRLDEVVAGATRVETGDL